MTVLTHRAKRRARALALQIYSAGVFYPCNCGLSGCMFRHTKRSIANKIIEGQTKILKLNEVTIREALRMVSIVDD